MLSKEVTTSLTRLLGSSRHSPSWSRLVSVLLVKDLENTRITRGGLLTLCRLELAALTMSKVIINLDSNGYGDEGVLVVARHLPSLVSLWTGNNELSREGVTAVASSLTQLKKLGIHDNEEIRQGVTQLGRLPMLDNTLFASTCQSM